jgi:hypothetical protein
MHAVGLQLRHANIAYGSNGAFYLASNPVPLMLTN